MTVGMFPLTFLNQKLTPVLMEMGGDPGISHPFFISSAFSVTSAHIPSKDKRKASSARQLQSDH